MSKRPWTVQPLVGKGAYKIKVEGRPVGFVTGAGGSWEGSVFWPNGWLQQGITGPAPTFAAAAEVIIARWLELRGETR